MKSFTRNRSYITRPFTVDFVAKKTYIEPLNQARRVIDFMAYTFVAWLFFVVFLGVIGALFFTWLMPQYTYAITFIVGWYAVYMTLFIIMQALLYKAFPKSKLMVDMQMLAEAPYHRLFFHPRKDTIELNKATKVTFTSLHYWKFDLDFFGECKDFRKSMRYEKVPFKNDSHNLIIEFTKPVTGKISGTIYGFFDQLVIQ